MPAPVPAVVVWLKRDLRATDHAALATAVARARGGAVVALFVYEPEVLGQPEWHPSHTEFQRECLVDVERSLRTLGIRLVTRRGEAVAALERLRRELGFGLLVAHEETGTAVTYARDRRVRRWAREVGIELVELPQTGVVRRLPSRDGWNRLWEQRMTAPQATVPRAPGSGGRDRIGRLESAGLLGCRDLGLPPDLRERQAGGQRAAEGILADFLARRGRGYAGGISSPVHAATNCSRLSPYLAFGAISLRQVWQACEARRLTAREELATATDGRQRVAAEAWQRSLRAVQSRLHWHCHFMQKLEDEPAIESANMLRAADGLRDPGGYPERLAAWQAGRTGYPLVDACMRSLVATGWATFRMRALLVSFASYSLWLDWRPTGLYLARQFLDFEPGIHWAQMQMQSGTTGINTLRIYNPTKQALEQDPHGVFIRRWVPELAGVPTAYLHEPWTMPPAVQQGAGCLVGRDYAAPIVDHAAEVRVAKRRLAAVRGEPEARAEARAVARRHGSRRDRRGAMQQDPVRRGLFGKTTAADRKRKSSTHADPQRRFLFDLDGDQPAGPAGDRAP
ncbi:MAG: deoxyribodipyrimidine photo-lyase/cryptochrome family protein [Planctomycetes bacterium]|nr:deoxyribodipyrimidine photo-lyase/cryptochrome family protein [Planctomycetota bacterium]